VSMSKITLAWIVSIFVPSAFSQPAATTPVTVTASATTARRDTVHRVDPGQMYHRVYARVPIVGTGTKGDPKRPMFAPVVPQTPPTGPAAAAVHTGILGYTMLISDDGNWALCEFVGATPQDLQIITSAAGPNVVVFERGTSTVAAIEADFQQYMKGFTFASFEPFTTRVQ
jgi:hypothetical protein